MVVILSPDILPEIRMTVDEYLSADLPEGYRYELVEGVVEMSPIPGIPHDAVIEKLHRLFVLYSTSHPHVVAYVTQRSGVVLPPRRTVREPDFAIYGPTQKPTAGRSWKEVCPALIVEVVSPGQSRRDYEAKRSDYWEAGLPEYWIADPEAGTLTVLIRGANDWNEQRLDRAGVYRPERFPGLQIPVGAVLEA